MFRYKLMSFILSFISFVLLIVVQASSAWATYLEDPLFPVYTGLWTICTEDECSALRVRETNLDVVRSFMLLALFFCFLALWCSLDWDYFVNCTEDFFPEGPIASIFSFLTGTCVLIALLVFELSISELIEPQVENISNKWAVFLSAGVCLLCYVTGIFSLCLYRNSLWSKASSQVTPEKSDPAPSESIAPLAPHL